MSWVLDRLERAGYVTRQRGRQTWHASFRI
jgi:DNA-binding MarR family transcriptional regulator